MVELIFASIRPTGSHEQKRKFFYLGSALNTNIILSIFTYSIDIVVKTNMFLVILTDI